MNQVLKTWVLWLLILALPAQGYAAALGLSCGSQRSSETRTVFAEFSSHAMHKPGRHQSGKTDHIHDMGTADVGSSDISSPHAGHDGSKCSACAECCFGAGAAIIPFALIWIPFAQRVTVSVSSPVLPFSGHIPAALERPPRAFFA